MLGLSLRSLVNSGYVMSGGLSEFEVKDYPDGLPEEGELIRIEGRQMGIAAWALQRLSLVDPLFTFSVSKDFMTLAQGDKKYSVVPTQEIHSFSVGFRQNKLLLVTAILLGVAAVLAFIMGVFFAMKGGGLESFSPFVLFAVLALVDWILFKYSQRLEVVAILVSEDRVRSEFGIRVKSAFTGEIVDETQVAQAHDRMKAICQQFSKFY